MTFNISDKLNQRVIAIGEILVLDHDLLWSHSFCFYHSKFMRVAGRGTWAKHANTTRVAYPHEENKNLGQINLWGGWHAILVIQWHAALCLNSTNKEKRWKKDKCPVAPHPSNSVLAPTQPNSQPSMQSKSWKARSHCTPLVQALIAALKTDTCHSPSVTSLVSWKVIEAEN